MSTIPKEISHLDFDPATEEKPEFSKLKECDVHKKGTQEGTCVHPAAWLGTFRCCSNTVNACTAHKQKHAVDNTTTTWWCRTCKKTRSNEWMGWTPL